MNLYYLWDPGYFEGKKNHLSVVLTHGAADQIGKGTDEFIRNLLQDIGVDITPDAATWHLQPFRTSYYSEYPDEDDWRDVWRIVWRLSVDTSTPPQLEIYDPLMIGTDATDDSWSYAEDIRKKERFSCAVVLCADNPDIFTEIKNTILGDADNKRMQEKYGVAEPSFTRIKVESKIAGYHQLQIDLGEFDIEFFQDGADYALRVTDQGKKQGAIAHFQDLPL
jgi:hemin uptake protein HemP